ncbi:hypothetical protein PAPYR_1822 [Paratrimastix pyriformis]|uniref:Uncharacterized protein n=1 Tax=Paratrimastix pyriformis TaxID=342808 RepID=A0ABQ8URD2_9EUKA|nr:hypothetical protein PAPYR_1822 [Paratrimastix pyriformis]
MAADLSPPPRTLWSGSPGRPGTRLSGEGEGDETAEEQQARMATTPAAEWRLQPQQQGRADTEGVPRWGTPHGVDTRAVTVQPRPEGSGGIEQGANISGDGRDASGAEDGDETPLLLRPGWEDDWD